MIKASKNLNGLEFLRITKEKLDTHVRQKENLGNVTEFMRNRMHLVPKDMTLSRAMHFMLDQQEIDELDWLLLQIKASGPGLGSDMRSIWQKLRRERWGKPDVELEKQIKSDLKKLSNDALDRVLIYAIDIQKKRFNKNKIKT